MSVDALCQVHAPNGPRAAAQTVYVRCVLLEKNKKHTTRLGKHIERRQECEKPNCIFPKITRREDAEF
jgi:hypothetical protein